MKYGHFDDQNREYVIETPFTPTPWINYLGDSSFFSLISNTAGGYSFYKDAKLRRITRYRYNNVPADMDGRHFYIKEGELVFSPAYLPCMEELDHYECHHGLGYSTFLARKNQLETKLTVFVPLGASLEIQQLQIKNSSDVERKISVFAAEEWCLWNASDDGENFQRNLSTGEVEIEGNAIYHKTEYRERRNHYAFYAVNQPIASFETDRLSFLGHNHGFDKPIQVKEGKLKNGVASGWHPIAANQVELTIKPGESKTIIYLLGYCELPQEEKFSAPNIINKKPAKEMIERYGNEEKAAQALLEIKKHWDGLLSVFHVKSKDEKLDRMANIWNQYQCMVTFLMSRSASYYESGIGRGMGFRDSCQDLLGFVHIIPSRARERILDIASIQKEDGSTYHQYQPLTKTGNSGIGSGFNDDPLWLIAATSAYIKETGDLSILKEMVPFDSKKGSEKTLWEHLHASIDFTINHLGPHGLPLIGRADWNDCLNLNCFSLTPGESFQTTANKETGIAESVFIAGMFVKYGREYADLARAINLEKEAKRVELEVEKVSKATLQSGWDGEWFLRAYDGLGGKVGSHECQEGQIYIEPQGFCVMAGIGHESGEAKKALSSAERILGNRWGLELLRPCYTNYHPELGEISSYPPGYKENGAVFNHNNPWVVIAHCQEGENQEAFDLYAKNAPAYIEEESDVHVTEPYVYSQMIAGRDAPHYGEAKNSWLTGSATWSFVALSQYLLGIRPSLSGLIIDPHLPPSFKSFEVDRKYRGNVYHIRINNEKQEKRLYVNGCEIQGNMVSFSPSKGIVEIELK